MLFLSKASCSVLLVGQSLWGKMMFEVTKQFWALYFRAEIWGLFTNHRQSNLTKHYLS